MPGNWVTGSVSFRATPSPACSFEYPSANGCHGPGMNEATFAIGLRIFLIAFGGVRARVMPLKSLPMKTTPHDVFL